MGFRCCLLGSGNKMSRVYITLPQLVSGVGNGLPCRLRTQRPLQVPSSVSLSAGSSPLIVLGTGNLLPVNLGPRKPGKANVSVLLNLAATSLQFTLKPSCWSSADPFTRFCLELLYSTRVPAASSQHCERDSLLHGGWCTKPRPSLASCSGHSTID